MARFFGHLPICGAFVTKMMDYDVVLYRILDIFAMSKQCLTNKGGTAYRKIITLELTKKGGSYGTA